MLRFTVMPKAWSIFCDCPELAVDVARGAEAIGLAVAPEVRDRPWEAAIEALNAGDRAGLAVEAPLSPDVVVRLAEGMRSQKQRIPVAVIGPQPLGLLHDLGLPAVHETGPLLAVAALLELGTERPWAATTKELPAVDRVRLGESVSHRSDGKFVRVDDGLIAHEAEGSASKPIGAPRDVAAALRAMRASQDPSRPKVPLVQGVEADTVLDVILGPKRALSDPASKAALGPYDLPLPFEELCSTPSRAASEAARIGFPVRVALASPDLRLWDHPDLAAEVFSAGQARDAFRQIMAVAKTRAEDARLLGVTVSASTMARTLLRSHGAAGGGSGTGRNRLCRSSRAGDGRQHADRTSRDGQGARTGLAPAPGKLTALVGHPARANPGRERHRRCADAPGGVRASVAR